MAADGRLPFAFVSVRAPFQLGVFDHTKMMASASSSSVATRDRICHVFGACLLNNRFSSYSSSAGSFQPRRERWAGMYIRFLRFVHRAADASASLEQLRAVMHGRPRLVDLRQDIIDLPETGRHTGKPHTQTCAHMSRTHRARPKPATSRAPWRQRKRNRSRDQAMILLSPSSQRQPRPPCLQTFVARIERRTGGCYE